VARFQQQILDSIQWQIFRGEGGISAFFGNLCRPKNDRSREMKTYISLAIEFSIDGHSQNIIFGFLIYQTSLASFYSKNKKKFTSHKH
jgi:hypothetical protein